MAIIKKIVGDDKNKVKTKPTAKPIALQEVRVTAQRKLNPQPDSMSLGRGSNQAKYSMPDIKSAVKNNPKLMSGVDTTSKASLSKSLYMNDKENMAKDLMKASKRKK